MQVDELSLAISLFSVGLGLPDRRKTVAARLGAVVLRCDQRRDVVLAVLKNSSADVAEAARCVALHVV